MGWILRMAWRDTRGSRRRLTLFLLAMVVGVAALVAINSFGENLIRAVDEESSELLGADLELESRSIASAATSAFVDSLGGRQAKRVSFSSMAYFPAQGATRLMTVRSIEGDYPFYGRLGTTPAEAAESYQSGRYALVDATVMREYDLAVGDSVRVGEVSYSILGSLDRTPRESTAFMLASPRIYLPLEHLDEALLGYGSRLSYAFYLAFDDQRNVGAMVDELRPRLQDLELRAETIEDVRQNWDAGLTNVYRFLGLAAFLAVILGAVGVASAVHVFVRSRIDTIAVLRCLGASGNRPPAIYLTQALAMGILGAVVGSLLGTVIQLILPIIMADFLPMEVGFDASWSAVGMGLAVGVVVTIVFAILPLVGIRNVPPLRAIRASVEPAPAGSKRWRLVILLVLAVAVTLFAVNQAPNTITGIGYALGLLVVFGLLSAVARGLMTLARIFLRPEWPYVLRQGVANVFRPNNQTLLLTTALGLGTFLMLTLFLVQQTLVAQIRIAEEEGRPDLVFFDIQSNQVEDVTAIVDEIGLPIVESVPIVSMRIESVNGVSVDEIRADTLSGRSGWALSREYRSTYRAYQTDSEEVVEGEFIGRWEDGSGLVPVSVEVDVADEMGIGIGDEVEFSVSGRTIATRVASLREVDWRRLSTNFFVVFPTGVLEDAPKFYVLLARAGTNEVSGLAQREVVRAHPNVSSIDLNVVLSTFEALFGRISTVLGFMMLFSIVAGVFVLAGAIMVSRSRRTEETVLLKTLGAGRMQVMQIMIVEYSVLGVLASLTGLVLAYGGSWALARFVFETPFRFVPVAALLAVIIVVTVAVVVGSINSRGIYRRSPLAVLRAEL